MQPSVALCMIVRDEQATLARCLESARPATSVIYVTDTGSSDDTPAIAERFGAKIRHFDWCDDFSAARNYSIQNVSEDWILILDADDHFPESEAARLPARLSEVDDSIVTLTLDYTIMDGYTPAATRRVLRNHRGLMFSGIIHESIRTTLPVNNPHHTLQTDIRLRHGGYTGASMPAKLKRNLPLLQAEWKRCLNTADNAQQMTVGKELAHTLIELGKPQEGEALLLKLLSDWPASEETDLLATEAFVSLLWHYQQTDRQTAVWQLCERLQAHLNGQPVYNLYRGICAFQSQNFAEAWKCLQTFERAWLGGQVRIPVPLPYTSLALWDMQGQCCLQMNRAETAVDLFTKCLQAGGDATGFRAKLHLAQQFIKK